MRVPEHVAVLDLQHLTESAASFQGADDAIPHLRARERVLGAIELLGGFQQPSLLIRRNSAIPLGLTLGPDLHAESMERRCGKAYVFGGAGGEYQGTIRTAWESLVLLANGIEPTRTRAHGRVNRDKLAEIDLHWHNLRHEAACRWLAMGLDLRAIQLLLGHADLKTTQRYLNVTDEELRKTMAAKLWNRGSAR